MKKILIISSFSLIFLLILFSIAALYLSFFKIKPITKNIHTKIEDKLSEFVFFPKGVTKSYYSFDETSYIWEMETPQKEHVAVELIYTPAFTKNQKGIIAALRMVEGGDSSIFDKVLPALIRDAKSLSAARDIMNQNPQVPDNVSYNSISLSINEEKNLLGSVTWEFDKSRIIPEAEADYKRLDKYPPFLLKFLYLTPQFLTRIFSGV